MYCHRASTFKYAAAGLVATAVAATATSAAAMPPPQSPEPPAPAESLDDVRTRSIEAYLIRRGLKTRTEAARLARQRLENLPPGLLAVTPIVGTAVAGAVEIPIVTLTFGNMPSPPYPVADLQRQLFDGPSPTGTMSEHYREMSGGGFDVSGEVFDWVPLPQNDVFYAGPAGCNGICTSARLGEMLTAALAGIDQTVDFSRFDNNGPDNMPNSGDDDGFVDFVAFVHPESGGECGGVNDNIWSHRFSIQSWTGANFETDDVGQQGINILVDDYVIMPAFACDGQTMIQIGVFSHEFGHAFGLPDLYDSQAPDESAGIGGWGLMASGSWGGDGSSRPKSPSHMTGLVEGVPRLGHAAGRRSRRERRAHRARDPLGRRRPGRLLRRGRSGRHEVPAAGVPDAGRVRRLADERRAAGHRDQQHAGRGRPAEQLRQRQPVRHGRQRGRGRWRARSRQ